MGFLLLAEVTFCQEEEQKQARVRGLDERGDNGGSAKSTTIRDCVATTQPFKNPAFQPVGQVKSTKQPTSFLYEITGNNYKAVIYEWLNKSQIWKLGY